MAYTFHGVRLVDASSDLPGADLTVTDWRIQSVMSAAHPSEQADAAPAGDGARSVDASETAVAGAHIDVSDMILVPGFIDVHTHGGGGFNLHTTDPAEIQAFSRWVVSTGVTSYLIGVVGTPHGLPEAQLRAAALVSGRTGGESSDAGAEALGIHLEGPYISEHRRGAHLAAWLRVPSQAETERLLELADRCLRIITVAPELPGAKALIRRMVAAGVTVSIGHTDANYEQAREAILWGARHATHCCNAMRPLLHRDPGPISAISEAPQVYGELIADGLHVHPAMMRLLLKVLGPERTIVITDALAGAGVSEGTFEFNGQHASVVHGLARLDDGTITGSVLTMDQALRNILRLTDLSPSDAVGMLTCNPAQAAGAAARKGRLAAGYDADLVLLDDNFTVQATIRGGRLVYATKEWRERLADIPSALTTAAHKPIQEPVVAPVSPEVSPAPVTGEPH